MEISNSFYGLEFRKLYGENSNRHQVVALLTSTHQCLTSYRVTVGNHIILYKNYNSSWHRTYYTLYTQKIKPSILKMQTNGREGGLYVTVSSFTRKYWRWANSRAPPVGELSKFTSYNISLFPFYRQKLWRLGHCGRVTTANGGKNKTAPNGPFSPCMLSWTASRELNPRMGDWRIKFTWRWIIAMLTQNNVNALNANNCTL